MRFRITTFSSDPPHLQEMEFSLDPKSLGALVFWENVVQSLRQVYVRFHGSSPPLTHTSLQHASVGLFIRQISKKKAAILVMLCLGGVDYDSRYFALVYAGVYIPVLIQPLNQPTESKSWQLIAARVTCSIALASMMPISQSVLTDSVPNARRGAAFGLLGFWSSLGQVANSPRCPIVPMAQSSDASLMSRGSAARFRPSSPPRLRFAALGRLGATAEPQRGPGGLQVFHLGILGGDVYGWRLSFLLVGVTSAVLGAVIQAPPAPLRPPPPRSPILATDCRTPSSACATHTMRASSRAPTGPTPARARTEPDEVEAQPNQDRAGPVTGPQRWLPVPSPIPPVLSSPSPPSLHA